MKKKMKIKSVLVLDLQAKPKPLPFCRTCDNGDIFLDENYKKSYLWKETNFYANKYEDCVCGVCHTRYRFNR